jgi:Plasmid pRiA4b ORF-3-like protein
MNFLEAIGDPKHPEHRDILIWIGGTFDPNGFDLNAINRTLRFGGP